MKPSHLLLLTAAALLPAAALAKPKSSGSSGKGLPPKFGGLIQPAPATDGTEPGTGGVISSELVGKDLEFLTHTIELGRVQSWLVQTAQEKAETPEVRALGGALAEIQADENRYVAKLASLKGVVIPSATEPAPEQKKLAAKMKPLSGPKLEKALVEEIVSAAEKSVAEYEAGRQSPDADIKRLAEQMLPAAKSRLQFASRASGRAQDTSARPTFRTGGSGIQNARPSQAEPAEPGAVKSQSPAARETAPAATSQPLPVRAPATPASSTRPGKATPAPKAAPEPAPAPAKAPASTPPPQPPVAIPAPQKAAAPAPATPLPVPPPPTFTPLAPGSTPPPRPPKPTPVSEKSVLPSRPSPPDFSATTIPPLATPAPATPAPQPPAAAEASAPEATPAATPAREKTRKRK